VDLIANTDEVMDNALLDSMTNKLVGSCGKGVDAAKNQDEDELADAEAIEQQTSEAETQDPEETRRRKKRAALRRKRGERRRRKTSGDNQVCNLWQQCWQLAILSSN